MKEVKTMTTREVADVLGVSKNRIQETGKRLFPKRMIAGVTTYWTEDEVTAIRMEIERNRYAPNLHNAQDQLVNSMTTAQIASTLGVQSHLVWEIGTRLFPNKERSNGVVIQWTENEVTEISKEIKRTAGMGNSQIQPLVQTKANQQLPSTRKEVLERAGNALKDLLQVIADMDADSNSIRAENEMLRHQVGYNEVIGCSRWTDVKKLLGIKDRWEAVVNALELEEGVDWFQKCMGYDKYPTILLPDNTVNRIKEEY